MSVLLELTIFPLDQGGSGVSRFVAPVVAMVRDSGYPHQLGPMGTVVETETLPEALALIERAQAILDAMGCERVYAVAKFDMRKRAEGRLEGKIASVEHRLGAPE
ncbi:hypothetical protein MARPU_07870 [Marichromatium purpuratum 984]|uniref:Thiamine-binding protein domain-containing protein n=1 Tax=Marichromatium purpuratum 984 TaxID=765910 RepID=W0DYV8_MARPU|nr:MULTISPECIES: MTH1187 family thiamine-binding protein [Marichromatium]AHF03790.1 hypothetical protein MARPU_07870 [Marichromatium purpuratum 984]MBO8084937.1 MTH1187 family thiamine-binding protein [Marichromatium sp.]RNE94624.1 thiamine-binding protein [Marichromatium sp. AB32]